MKNRFPLSALCAAALLACASARAATPNEPAEGTPEVDTPALAPVNITGSRLREARIDLSPKVGTTIYTIDQKLVNSLGQGDAAPVDEVLLHLPGVAKDSKASGSLHVRDDHGNVQYRLNGIQLPEGISGFGQSFDTRIVDKIDFVTGALPAQYGLRTAGIIDIQTKEGDIVPGGRYGVLFGGQNTIQPSLELFGSKGALSYYLSGSYAANSLGIENPTSSANAIHDRTRQLKSFGNLSYLVDDDTRLGLIFGSYNGKFQIPNNPGQAPGFSLAGFSDTTTGFNALPSAQLNQQQTEVNRYAILSLQRKIGDLDFQLSGFQQYSNLHYLPDPAGDLIYRGVASDSFRSNSATGLQLDASWKLNPTHTVRAGAAYTRQLTRSNNSVSVFAVDGSGAQVGNVPVTIADNTGKTGNLASLYLQDEWRIAPKLTFNYGMRFDHVAAFTNEYQWSPRLNVAYQLSPATSVHAGYSRYFTPPPQELASQGSINLYQGTTNQPEVALSSNVKAERTNYFDAGVAHKLSENLTVSADAYYKKIRNLIDEGQFGQALILSPFNYDQGYAQGLELSGTYNSSVWNGFLNFAAQKAQGKNIVSGQSLFGAAELAYIANNYIYLDHNQTYTLSGGLSYTFGDSRLSSDFVYGSGLRRTLDGGTPNGATLAPYTVVNAALTHTWKTAHSGALEGRIAILNLFDKSYLLRDGTGVGVGAPQYGLRRTLYVGLAKNF